MAHGSITLDDETISSLRQHADPAAIEADITAARAEARRERRAARGA